MENTPHTSPTHLSNRVAKLTPSATIGLIGRIAQLNAEGVSVISFGQGEPDFNTPEPIKAAGIHAIEQNITHYTPAGGFPELCRAIAQQVERDNGIACTAKQIAVTTGAKEALYIIFQAICNDGDEVIIPAPYWVSYIDQVHLAGGTPVVVDTDATTGFKMTAETLAAHITPRTRAMILNSPSNPTGAVYTADELAALAAVLRPTNAMIISDEIYDAICYVAYARWLRVAPDFVDRTLIVNGVSKTYAMTGWRIGYVAGPQPVISAIKGILSHSTTHPATMAQKAALVAYTAPDTLNEVVTSMVAAFKERRDMVVDALNAIPGVICSVPDGAFYVFPNVSGLLNRPLKHGTVCHTSQELADYLLDYAHIGVVFGEAFGAPGCLRLSYAQSKETLLEGIRRFADAVSE